MTSVSALTSRGKYSRNALFALAFIASSLVAGTVYGWPPLRRLLLAEDGTLGEKRLARHFTAGSWSVQGGRFVAGMSRDHLGTRFTCCACLAFVTLGAVALAAAGATEDALLTCGMFAVGLGSGVQLCVQPVAALFPERASTVMSALSGAFQISGLVFLALTAGDDREIGFYVFAACAATLFAACFVMLPNGQSFFETVADDVVVVAATTTAQSGDVDVDGEEDTAAEEKPSGARDAHARLEGLANGQTRGEQMKSAEYFGLVGWFTLVVCPLQFYIAAIGYQLELKGDDDGHYASIFSAAYGSVAIFAAYGGRVADKVGCGVCQGLATLSTAISFLILALPKSAGLGVQVFGMLLYSFGRLFIFAMYFSNIGRRFGFEHYGTLCGLGLLVSAIWSLIQYPLLAWAVDSAPIGANMVCFAMMTVTLPYTAWLARRELAERRAAKT